MEETEKKRGGARLPVYDENGKLIKKGAGRIPLEKTSPTSFRVNTDSLNICREHHVKLNDEVNKLVKKIAKRIKKIA